MPSPRWRIALAAALFISVGGQLASSQEPAAAPAAEPQPATGNSGNLPKTSKKHSHASDFLVRGTVFTEKGLSFPGVQLRIRRTGDKKFHWETYTDSRGEFAVRVPQGSEYEIVVHAKGTADQTRTVYAKTGLGQGNIVFRMEQAGGKQ
jgi:hypothetical protein